MGRENTIVFGSQVGTPAAGTSSAPTPRTGTLIQHGSASERARSPEPAPPSVRRAPLPPVSAPPRYGSDPGPASARAPVSNRFESQWFAPTNPRLAPIGNEVFGRRGWQPPPPSRGIAFAAVSLLLVGVAAAGTFFFLGPDSNRSQTTPVSTTTITNAEVPAPPADPPAPPPETTTAPMVMRTVTPNDLPAAPPVVDAVKEPAPAGWHATKGTADSKANAAPPAPARRSQKATAPAKAAKEPATTKPSEGALPDLDRAASAAGMNPQQEDPFATPGNDTPPATPPQEPAGAPAAPSAPSTAPAPSEVMPDLEIKR